MGCLNQYRINGGIYFTFSVFVMSSLNQIAANQAIEAMNSINRVILKSGFMPLFFGSCIVALGLIGLSLLMIFLMDLLL